MSGTLARFAALTLLICCSGCLTFGRFLIKTQQNVTFVSDPEGAKVESGEVECEAPCGLHLSPVEDHTITFRKEGYKSELVVIRSEHGWDGAGMSFATNTAIWGWWTLGIGTAAGMLVDLSSGSMKSLDLPDDKTIRVTLTANPEN